MNRFNVILDNDTENGITKYQNGLGIDHKLKMKRGTDARYFLTDHLGSTNALTDASGEVLDSTNYDAFGNATNPGFTELTRYQFTGREYDEFTGLQYSRARWYSPELGRFISEDPIGFRSSDINLYGYVVNNPTSLRDPLGKDIWGIAAGGSGGIGTGKGIGASGASLYGISGTGPLSSGEFDLGMAGSYGAYSSDSCPTSKGSVVGFGGGLSVGIFGSNARKFSDLEGGFDSYFFGLGPVSVEFDIGTAGDGYPVGMGQIGLGIPNASVGKFGYANYPTTTPPASIITARGAGSGLAGNISNLYGAGY